MAASILKEFESHHPLRESEVKIDFVFAYADVDEKTNERTNDALTKNGVKCLDIARKISLKDRALGHGDCEVSLDGDWWQEASDKERKALLDHELHHFALKANRFGVVQIDDLGRPKISIRPHDHDFGWFDIIAQRHGIHSQERKQANALMEIKGQFYFPEIVSASENRIQKLELHR